MPTTARTSQRRPVVIVPPDEEKPRRASRAVQKAAMLKIALKKKRPLKSATKTVVVKVRRQGGARVMTIPPVILASLGADEGTELAVDVKGGKLVAEPVAPESAQAPRRRYTLAELLQGAEHLPEIYASVAGALDGEPIGNEIG